MNNNTPAAPRARYIMIGGFLGAGKTTSVARLAERLTRRGQRVGLITNDQGTDLVDTAMLRSRGFSTEEISGGCFCCRFNSLLDAARKLNEQTRPDVFIAEPVGSCTDLVATVTYPLRRIYGENFSIAPLSVVVDPVRAARVFGLQSGGTFTDKVLYIFRKQLEEADLIVINKSDSVTTAALASLQDRLATQFPRAEVLHVSARTGAGLEDWFERIESAEQPGRRTMDVNYETYADGEALLGWLNATLQIDASGEFDGNRLLQEFAAMVQSQLRAAAAEIAHLKMTLSPASSLPGLAVINAVRNDQPAELSQSLDGEIDAAELILNLRAEAEPDVLRQIVVACAATFPGPRVRVSVDHMEAFKPGKPQPTHRDSVA